jgi:CheY-like chemotaxis protein
MMSPERVTVFVVDDNEVDIEVIRRAFARRGIPNRIVEATDGVDALAKLRAGAVPAPFIVLLDLNMPRMSGLEMLQELRGDPDLRDAVVFVLTTSRADEDMVAAYDRHVAGYIVKGNAGPDFGEVPTLLDTYWRVVELPAAV